jgi:hypothetical protein
MNIAHYISNLWKEALEYKERVLKDGGTTKREDVVQQYNQMCKQSGIFDSIKFAWLGEAGGTLRTSGANQFWTKAYSMVTPQAKYGPELVVNGDFSNGTTGWSNISGATFVEGGKLRYLNAGPYRNSIQTGILTVGTLYKITVSVSNFVSGSLYFILGTQQSLPVITDNGTYTRYAYCTATTDFSLYSTVLPVNTFDIDNVSVVEVLNSLDGSPTDTTQTTSTSQPYLTGNIAPNEKWGLKNTNGNTMYMTHPTISFTANEAWSITIVVNCNGTNTNLNIGRFFSSTGLVSQFRTQNSSFTFINESSSTVTVGSVNSYYNIIGKTSILSLVAKGDGTLNFI